MRKGEICKTLSEPRRDRFLDVFLIYHLWVKCDNTGGATNVHVHNGLCIMEVKLETPFIQTLHFGIQFL